MSYSIRWFGSELIECYWRFVNCRGSCHQRQMEQEMLNTLDKSCFSFYKSVLIYVSVFVLVELIFHDDIQYTSNGYTLCCLNNIGYVSTRALNR